MIKNLLPTIWQKSDLPLRRGEENPFLTLQREINQMFDNALHGFNLPAFGGVKGFGEFLPSIDVREDEKEISVKAELPGMEEKDIEVTLSDDALTISGEKKEEKETKGKDYYHRETSYGSFRRVIPLPAGINTEKVEARFKNGVLTVTMPRLQETPAKQKRIAVKTE